MHVEQLSYIDGRPDFIALNLRPPMQPVPTSVQESGESGRDKFSMQTLMSHIRVVAKQNGSSFFASYNEVVSDKNLANHNVADRHTDELITINRMTYSFDEINWKCKKRVVRQMWREKWNDERSEKDTQIVESHRTVQHKYFNDFTIPMMTSQVEQLRRHKVSINWENRNL